MKQTKWLLVIALAIGLAMPAAIWAGSKTAQVTGVVTDENDQPLSGVTIDVVDSNGDGQVVASATTDEEGKYSIVLNDATRSYAYKLSKDGYVPFRTDLKVPTAKTSAYNFQLPSLASRKSRNPDGSYNMSEDALPVFNEGVNAIKAGDFDTAAEKFEKVVELDPSVVPAYSILGGIYLKDGKAQEALDMADKALAIEPENEKALLVRVKGYEMLGDSDKADEARAAYLKAVPAEATKQLLKEAEADYNAGNMSQARETLEKLVAQDPDNPRANYLFGLVLVNQGDNAAAKEHLQKFVQLAPDDPDASTAQQMIDYLNK
jgi:Tfp pilus assembly protein PilF